MSPAFLVVALLCAGTLFSSVAARKLNQAVAYMSPNGESCSCPDGHKCPQCPGHLAICRNGQCQSGDFAEQCVRDNDCSQGLYCVFNKCVGSQVQTCKGPGADHCACSSHSQCASGFCNPITWKCQTMPCSSDFQCSAVAPGTICKLNQCWKADSHTAAPSLPTWPSFPSTPSLPSFPSQQIVPQLVTPLLPVLPSTPCPLNAVAVCGVNGVTYPNTCTASANGVAILHTGPCVVLPQACPCTGYQPVCGSDHITYPNACSAGCKGVTILFFSACPGVRPIVPHPPSCNCPYLYDPVCSSSGVTYNNQCEAECLTRGQGLAIIHRGRCEDGNTFGGSYNEGSYSEGEGSYDTGAGSYSEGSYEVGSYGDNNNDGAGSYTVDSYNNNDSEGSYSSGGEGSYSSGGEGSYSRRLVEAADKTAQHRVAAPHEKAARIGVEKSEAENREAKQSEAEKSEFDKSEPRAPVTKAPQASVAPAAQSALPYAHGMRPIAAGQVRERPAQQQQPPLDRFFDAVERFLTAPWDQEQ